MNLDLHVVALVVAAGIGIILETLDLLSLESLISLTLLIVAVSALHTSVEGAKVRKVHEVLLRVVDDISAIKLSISPTDLKLITPKRLISFTSEFTARNRGEIWWFNICVDMLQSQKLFDILIGSVLANPKTTRMRIVLKSSEKMLWDKFAKPRIEKCAGKEKLEEPIIADDLGNISFGLITNSDNSKEGLMSVWGEPFMMKRSSKEGNDFVLPRYLISIEKKSELILRIAEIFRGHYPLFSSSE